MSGHAISPESLLAQLRWRAAIKKFDPARTIPQAIWHALEEAMVLAPSSFGLQPWKFFVIKDPAIRAKLREQAYGQSQITDASHLIVFARRIMVEPHDVDRHIDRISEVRSAPRHTLEGFRSVMLGSISTKPAEHHAVWNGRQVYIALGMFLSACALLGVDACPMEGFEPEKFDETLGLKKHGYAATVLAAAGYRAADDPYANMPKVRFKTSDVVVHV